MTRTPLPFRRSTGFTIVELLIVIVIIAILATITIVAYNGIQQRARTSAVQEDLSTVARKMALDNINNGSYAMTAASVDGGNGLPSNSNTSYQFHSTGVTYCITGTNGNVSYKISDTSQTPTVGGCAGDGVGGAAAITNFATNPSFETDATGWSSMNCSSVGRDTTTAQSGATSYKCTSNSSTVFYFNGPATAVNPGETWSMSAYVKSDQARQIEIYISALSSTNTEVQRINSTYTTLAANTWTRVTASGVIPSGAVTAKIQLNFRSPLIGQIGWVDSVFYANSSQTPTYADGNTTNWIWNGTANNSTSTGPAA